MFASWSDKVIHLRPIGKAGRDGESYSVAWIAQRSEVTFEETKTNWKKQISQPSRIHRSEVDICHQQMKSKSRLNLVPQ